MVQRKETYLSTFNSITLISIRNNLFPSNQKKEPFFFQQNVKHRFLHKENKYRTPVQFTPRRLFRQIHAAFD
jgi:hypothetical protein